MSQIEYTRRLSNDSRDLINAKFVDIIKLHYYMQFSIEYKEFDHNSSKIGKHKTMLNSLSNLRNDLAHGSKKFSDQGYQLYKSSYLQLFTVIIETILFLQNTDISNLLFKNEDMQ